MNVVPKASICSLEPPKFRQQKNDKLFIKLGVPTRKRARCWLRSKCTGSQRWKKTQRVVYMLKACTLGEPSVRKKNTEKTTGRAPQSAKGFHSENFIRRTPTTSSVTGCGCLWAKIEMEECLRTDRGYGRAWFGNDPLWCWFRKGHGGRFCLISRNWQVLSGLLLRKLYHDSTALSDVTWVW